MCYGWCATSAYRLKIGVFCSNCMGQFCPRFQAQKVILNNHSSSENWDKYSLIRYKNLGRSLFRFVKMYAFDRQTDWRTDGGTFLSWLIPPCIICRNVLERWFIPPQGTPALILHIRHVKSETMPVYRRTTPAKILATLMDKCSSLS